MPIAVPKPRFPWIAVAALVGASLAAGDASASCSSMPDAGACPPACCCKATESATPTHDAAGATKFSGGE